MTNNSHYKIYEVNNQSYLFTSSGFDSTVFTDIVLRKFQSDHIEFFICTLSPLDILIFSNGSEFVDFLKEAGVKEESYKLTSFNYHEKPKDYDNLECILEDGFELHLSVSHLDGYHNGFLKGPESFVDLGYDRDNFNTHFPRLNKLRDTSAILLSTGIVDDENHKKYLEKSSGCLSSVIFFSVATLLYFLIN